MGRKELTGKISTLLILLLLTGAIFFFSLLKGKVSYTFSDLFSRKGEADIILLNIRLPRCITDLIVGGILSISGVVLQGILQNPLAEPYTLGISGGGALGTTIAVILGFGIAGRVGLSFAGALLSIFLVLLLAQRRGITPASLILSGVIISFLFTSLVLLLFSLSHTRAIHKVYSWMMGNLSTLTLHQAKIFFLLSLPFIPLLFTGRELNVLSMGDERAHSLGIVPSRWRLFLFLLTAYLAGMSISFTGIIGFVGLMVPHLLRLAWGEKQHLPSARFISCRRKLSPAL